MAYPKTFLSGLLEVALCSSAWAHGRGGEGLQSDRAGGRVVPAANLQLETGENKTALEPVTCRTAGALAELSAQGR